MGQMATLIITTITAFKWNGITFQIKLYKTVFDYQSSAFYLFKVTSYGMNFVVELFELFKLKITWKSSVAYVFYLQVALPLDFRAVVVLVKP